MLKIEMIGHLGQEPETRYTPANQTVTNISVADTRKWTGADGTKHEETTWYRFSAWGKQAEVISQYLHKGSLVYIEARPRVTPNVYTNNQGLATASNEATITRVDFLSSNGTRTPVGEGAPEEPQYQGEEIPF